jgi:hypothetical protein
MNDEEFVRQFVSDYTGGTMTPEQLARQQYEEVAGSAKAVATGAGEAITFGQLDKILSAIDDLIGAKGELTQEQKTQILKEQFPGAYAAGDIGTSLAMGAIPIGGQALLAARGVRGAQALGKAMPLIQAGMGSAQTAGRGGDVADIITSGMLSALPSGAPAAGRKVGSVVGRGTKKAGEQLRKQAKEARKEFSEVRKTYEPTVEMKAVRQAQKGAEKARAAEQKVTEGIFDEPASKMTAERAAQLQRQLGEARGAAGKAAEAEKAAISRAGGQFEAIGQAKQKAMAAEQAIIKNQQKIEQYAQSGGRIGKIAKALLTGPSIASVQDKLTDKQAQEIALVEAIEQGKEPSIDEIVKAAKTLMELAD